MPPKKAPDAAPLPRFGRVGSNLKMGIVGLPNIGKVRWLYLLCCIVLYSTAWNELCCVVLCCAQHCSYYFYFATTDTDTTDMTDTTYIDIDATTLLVVFHVQLAE